MAFPPISFVMYDNPLHGPALLTTDMGWMSKLKAMNYAPGEIVIETHTKKFKE
jgi:hypothetical protein